MVAEFYISHDIARKILIITHKERPKEIMDAIKALNLESTQIINSISVPNIAILRAIANISVSELMFLLDGITENSKEFKINLGNVPVQFMIKTLANALQSSLNNIGVNIDVKMLEEYTERVLYEC